MNLVVRPIKEEEVEEAQLLADSVMDADFPEYDSAKKPRILKEDLNIADRIHINSFTTWVTIIDGKIVGLISGILVCEVLMIHWIIVAKKCQKQGVGRKITEEFLKWGKENGANSAHLFSPDFNIPFYEKLGFENVGLVRKSFWGADDYFMNKVLE